MNTLTLWQLKERLAALNPFESSDTNVSGLTDLGTCVVFDLEDSEEIIELRKERDAIAKEFEDLDKETREELGALEAKVQRETIRADAAEDLLAEIKSGETTIADMVERTNRAEASQQEWMQHVRDARRAVTQMQQELTALRKKKGILPGYFAQQHELLSLLGGMVQYPDDMSRFRDRAKELQTKIYAHN